MIVALAIGLALLIQAFVVKPYQIPSGSMEPTLDLGQRVLVNRFIYHFTTPTIGDIVVFHPPVGRRQRPQCGAARSAARRACPQPTPESPTPTSSSGSSPAPATRLAIKDGHPVVNGVEAKEDFIRPVRRRRQLQFPQARSRSHPMTTS